MNALIVLSILGDTTHVSAPNRSTCCTTALKKLPDTRLVSPYLISIPCSLLQLFLAFTRFTATAGQSSSPSLEGAMKEAGLTDVRTSINRRQNTVAQYIATRPLLDLYERAT